MTVNKYKKTILDNGLRIVTESLPARTVSVGIWVNVGCRDESSQTNGCSHFVEHMLYKGTTTRNSRQIAMEFDRLGGANNAFTAKETTCFYATVLDSHLPELISIYSDLLLNSLFSQNEVERERSVISQELDMVEDTPEDLIHDLFGDLLWPGHQLSNTVLGQQEIISTMTRDKLMAHFDHHYRPDQIIISAAGNIDHDRFVDLLSGPFSRLKPASTGQYPVRIKPQPPKKHPGTHRRFNRPLEQVHLLAGTYGLPEASSNRYALVLLNTLLGGHMSSRLFQEIREKEALAYSIYSFIESNSDGGQVGIYTGVKPQSLNQVMALIQHIVHDLSQGTVNNKELELAKGYARSSMYISAESMDGRMLRLASNEFLFNRYISLAETEQCLEQVLCADLNSLAAELFNDPLYSVVLGPVGEA